MSEQGSRLYTKGYEVTVDLIQVIKPSKTWPLRRSTQRARGHYVVRATGADGNVLYDRQVKSGGIHRMTFPEQRAKAHARRADAIGFLSTHVQELPLVGKALARYLQRSFAAGRKASLAPAIEQKAARLGQAEVPAIVDFNESVNQIQRLHARGAKNHMQRTVYPETPEDRSVLVAGYLHSEKGEGRHRHSVATVLQVLQGQFRVIAWDGRQWTGGVRGPGTFINMGPHTPHLVEPHNPKNPKELNIIMVETLAPTSFKEGDGYNQDLPPDFPPIPQDILDQAEPPASSKRLAIVS